MSNVAAVIGINEYPASTSLNKLHGAVGDAADFADWVLNPNGGNVAQQDLFFWTYPRPAVDPSQTFLTAFLNNIRPWPLMDGPNLDRVPLSNDIFRLIPEIAKRAVQNNAERLYIFFAGHGAQTTPTNAGEDPQSCMIVGDFDKQIPSLGLVGCDDVRRYLQAFGPSEIVLVFDCCRSELALKVPRPHVPWNILGPLYRNERLGLARAAQETKVAYEIPQGAPLRGAFSQLLVDGLRRHRVQNRLTWSDLENYVNAGIGALVAPKEQVPDFVEKPRPPRMVLVTGPAIDLRVPLRLTFPLDFASNIEIRNQDAIVVYEGPPPTGALLFDIGSYSVELADGTVLIAFNHLGPGETDVRVV